MKVKELIAVLERCDKEKEVYLTVNYDKNINCTAQILCKEIIVVAQNDESVSLHGDDDSMRLESEDYVWLAKEFGV